MSKLRPILFSAPMVRSILAGAKTQTRRICTDEVADVLSRFETVGTPRYSAGDLFWVRETWYAAPYIRHPSTKIGDYLIGYAADGDIPHERPYRVVPSIHMPRTASRITLRVTSVRVERLQAISVEDSLAEGIEHRTMNDPRVEFQWLWDSINAKSAPWSSNPWVWVVSFERVEG